MKSHNGLRGLAAATALTLPLAGCGAMEAAKETAGEVKDTVAGLLLFQDSAADKETASHRPTFNETGKKSIALTAGARAALRNTFDGITRDISSGASQTGYKRLGDKKDCTASMFGARCIRDFEGTLMKGTEYWSFNKDRTYSQKGGVSFVSIWNGNDKTGGPSGSGHLATYYNNPSYQSWDFDLRPLGTQKGIRQFLGSRATKLVGFEIGGAYLCGTEAAIEGDTLHLQTTGLDRCADKGIVDIYKQPGISADAIAAALVRTVTP